MELFQSALGSFQSCNLLISLRRVLFSLKSTLPTSQSWQLFGHLEVRPMQYAAGDMTYLYNGLDGEIRKWTGQRLSKLSILNLRAYRFFPGSCRLPECLANLSLMAAVDSCDLSFLQRVCCVHGELEHYH